MKGRSTRQAGTRGRRRARAVLRVSVRVTRAPDRGAAVLQLAMLTRAPLRPLQRFGVRCTAHFPACALCQPLHRTDLHDHHVRYVVRAAVWILRVDVPPELGHHATPCKKCRRNRPTLPSWRLSAIAPGANALDSARLKADMFLAVAVSLPSARVPGKEGPEDYESGCKISGTMWTLLVRRCMAEGVCFI
jgi:hypothetical protein